MNVKVENIEKNVVQLEIEVDAAKFEEGMQKSFLKNAGRFNIPGFRKGKAPRKMVERAYGEQILYEDAINIVCPEAYDEAVDNNKLYPVDRPEIDIKQIGEGKSLIFTAKVTLKPEVELGEYKGVEVTKALAVVNEEDVENELQKTVEKNARLITVEDRGVKTGDTAVIDFEGFIDDVAFQGGKGTNHELVIGSGQFIPGFEDQLVDAKTGDEVKKLADQSKEASIMINNIIGNIQQKTEITVDAANNASHIIKEQMDSVTEADSAFKTILNAMGSISGGFESMGNSVNGMISLKDKTMGIIENVSSIAEESAATSEEVSASTQEQMAGAEDLSNLAKELISMAEELNKAISIFKV